MSLTSLLDKIAGRQQQRRKAYEADFRQLVVQIADGNEPDPEVIEDVLAASQKTVDDLREAVELLNRRRELRRAVDGVRKLEEERKRIEGAIAEADRIFNDANARHDATVDPLGIRLKQIKTLTSEADRARQELYSTCPNADLVSRLEEVTRPLDQAKRRLGSAETQARNLRNQAKTERADAELCVREPNAEAHVKEAENCDAQARELERELPGLRRQVADLERQDVEIRAKMLVP